MYLNQQFSDSTASQYLTVQPIYCPASPFTDFSSQSSSPASLSSLSSPNLSDSCDDINQVQMDQVENVKRLLRMLPPPITAEEFIAKNPFKGTDGHIKRPSNNFILFRKIAHDQKNQTEDLSDYNEREFSKIIGKIWEGLNPEEKDEYKKLGKKVADVHKKMHPNYKYQPKRDKAAWKHFNPMAANNSSQKPKTKKNIKQQSHQPEIINNVPLPLHKANLSGIQQHPKVNLSGIQQQPPIVSPISPNFIQPNNLSAIPTELENNMFYEPFNATNNSMFELDFNDYSTLFIQ